MSICVVIVNYRTAEMTLDCLRSLAAEINTVPPTECILVDNASDDGSAEIIARRIAENGWASWANVLPLSRNIGFAGGNNQALKRAEGAKYVLLLNSDTIVQAGALRACYERMESDSLIGAMSCLVLNRDGTVQNVARRFPTPLRAVVSSLGLPWRFPRLFAWADTEDPGWDRRRESRDVDWLGGAFLFCRRSVIEMIGGLDEDFFFYGEDIEFCHRIWRAGFRCCYAPVASIVHFGGGSSDGTRMRSEERTLLMWKARYLVQRKCFGRWAVGVVRGMDVATHVLRLGWTRVRLGRDHQRYHGLRASLRNVLAAI